MVHQKEHIGDLILSPRASETQFSRSEIQALNELARAAGIATYAIRTTMDLRASRERMVTAREEERRRLHRDLHDGLGPVLASMVLELDKARRIAASSTGDDPQKHELLSLLGEIKAHVQATVTDIRRLVYELRPPALDELGLVMAVREHASRNNGVLEISVEAPSNLSNLPAVVEVAAHRIIQEALNNVVQHAQASKCFIFLKVISELPTSLQIEITDDGIGLPDVYQAGVGLQSIYERAEKLGGACSIEKGNISGTRIIARLPLGGYL